MPSDRVARGLLLVVVLCGGLAAQGATLVKDIWRGSDTGVAGCASGSTCFFGNYGKLAIFVGDDGSTGPALWRTDGTEAGTLLVKDLHLGSTATGAPYGFTEIGGVLVFGVDDGVSGVELWRTDGTAAGTQLLKDIWPGPASSRPSLMTRTGNAVFFVAEDGVTGPELWKTDGTTDGTVLVADIYPGANGSSPVALVGLGNRVAFSASSPAHGREPWISDGTAHGTSVVDIVVGPIGSSPTGVWSVAGEVWFTVARNLRSEVWRTDGTASGTEMVYSFPGAVVFFPREFTGVGDQVFFVANDGINGEELWGNGPDGTRLVADVASGGSSSSPSELVESGGKLFFAAYIVRVGPEIYVTDGVTTRAASQFTSGGGFWRPNQLTEVGQRHIYFAADERPLGDEVWRSDGTLAGTALVADVHPTGSSAPTGFALSGGDLFFVADDGTTGRELWKHFPGATAQEVGTSCSGGDVIPRLSATDPVLGSTWTISGSGFRPGTAFGLLMSEQTSPARLGPCTLWVSSDTLGDVRVERVDQPVGPRDRALQFDGFGAMSQIVTSSDWSVSIPLPSLPSLTGRTIVLQAVVGPAETSMGFGLTNAVVATFGN